MTPAPHEEKEIGHVPVSSNTTSRVPTSLLSTARKAGQGPLCSLATLGADARPPLGSSEFLPGSAPAVTMASQLFVTPRLSFLTTGPHLSVGSNDRADRSLICAVTFCFITGSIQARGGLSR